jgi:hypothetical protein
LFTWLVIEGRLRPDLELLLAKPGGVDLGVWWAAAHADDVQFANAVAERFGSSPNWARQVIRHTAPVLCLWLGKTLGKTLGELTDDNFDAPPWRPTEPTCEPRPGTGSPGGAWRCASCVSRPRS